VSNIARLRFGARLRMAIISMLACGDSVLVNSDFTHASDYGLESGTDTTVLVKNCTFRDGHGIRVSKQTARGDVSCTVRP
jgi:hypothetical protein